MAERQAGSPADRRIVFRIGVNLGDVVVEGTATCSAMGSTSPRGWSSYASPAGCWSRAAFDHLQGRLGLPLEFTGEQQVNPHFPDAVACS